MELKQQIGLRVKIARRAQQLSQQQLAELIERTTETVSNIERAVTVPGIETLQRLSAVLDIPLADFFDLPTTPGNDHKRLRLEMQMRQNLSQLTLPQLEIASLQLEALMKMDGTW